MDQVKGEEGIPPSPSPLLPSTWKVGWEEEEEGATSWTLNLMVSSSLPSERGRRKMGF